MRSQNLKFSAVSGILLGIFLSFSASAKPNPCLEPMTKALLSRVREIKQPFWVFHYEVGGRMGFTAADLRSSAGVAFSDARIAKHLASRYAKAARTIPGNMLGGGLYVATDPVASEEFGYKTFRRLPSGEVRLSPKDDERILLGMKLRAGQRWLDLPKGDNLEFPEAERTACPTLCATCSSEKLFQDFLAQDDEILRDFLKTNEISVVAYAYPVATIVGGAKGRARETLSRGIGRGFLLYSGETFEPDSAFVLKSSELVAERPRFVGASADTRYAVQAYVNFDRLGSKGSTALDREALASWAEANLLTPDKLGE